MSKSSPPQSSGITAYIGNPALEPREARPHRPPDGGVNELAQRRLAARDRPRESPDGQAWDQLVAREVLHQELIEASFDRAEAHARLGDFEQAVVWLDRAGVLAGGLPGAYRGQRANWVRAGAVRAGPGAGEWKDGFTE